MGRTIRRSKFLKLFAKNFRTKTTKATTTLVFKCLTDLIFGPGVGG